MLAFPSEMPVKIPPLAVSCSILDMCTHTCTHNFWELTKLTFSVRCPRRTSQQSSIRDTKPSPRFPSLWRSLAPPVYCCLHLAQGNVGIWLSVRTTQAAAGSWFPKTWKAVSNILVSICYDKSADIIAT